MSASLSMKEYNSILEQIELTEDQQKEIHQMLSEGLLDKIGKKSLIGFLKIIKLLWDAGWYSVAHPIKSIKNIYTSAKYAIGAGAAGAAAYGAHYIRPYVDEAYMVYQLGQRFVEIVGDIKITSWNSVKEAGALLMKVPSLTNWVNLSTEDKIKIMDQLGLSSDAYGDLFRNIFEIAQNFALDNAWVILAVSLTMVAARFVSKFGSDLLQNKINDLSTTSNTSPTSNNNQQSGRSDPTL